MDRICVAARDEAEAKPAGKLQFESESASESELHRVASCCTVSWLARSSLSHSLPDIYYAA